MTINRRLHHPLKYHHGAVPAGVLMPPMVVEMAEVPTSFVTTITVGGLSIQVKSLQLLRAMAAVPCNDFDEEITRHGWYPYCERADGDKHPERFCLGDMTRCPWAGIRAQGQLLRKQGDKHG